jgi:hypothetical protein
MEDFGEPTRANMEVALQRACQMLPPEKAERHETRCYVAQKIIEAAHNGSRTLTKLTDVGRQAAIELKSSH